MLEVWLIGKFEIRFNGEPVLIPSRIAQSLFAYLVLTAGTSHRREKLAGMFWAEVPEEKARAYLRHELWRIRKALSTRSKVEYLPADDINIAFETSSDYWLDAAKIKELNEGASTDELMKTLSVYQGELLPGFYEDWITHEREHLHSIFEQRISQLLKLFENENRWQEMLEWGEHWISFAPGSEAAYRYLMIAYDALGDHTKIAATYKRCVQALRELDLEPSEETRTLAFKRTSRLNIPIPLTSFIGRDKEIKEVIEVLSKSRLVTLTGSGGVGKTRLAIQVVADVLDQFPDGVWFLDLAPLNDPASVPSTLAKVLDLQLIVGSSMSITDLLVDYLSSRSTLILFDNCEHLIDACADLVDALLKSCEGLYILATSREALRVSGEITYRVPSLEIPVEQNNLESLAKIESVHLFVERAKAALPSFMLLQNNALSTIQICQRLDGIPLAIELAAARVEMLSVAQIEGHLDNRFRLLVRGPRTVLPRHQTMRAVIDWSYNLLPSDEQALLQRLSVFVDGWTLDAAKAVYDDTDVMNLLAELVAKSLVLVDGEHDNEARYDFLETIRQYALEKLAESSKTELARNQHLAYFLKLAESAEPELYGLGQIEWARKLEDEHENMQAALEWSLRTNIISGQELAAALCWPWYLNGHLSEGYAWINKMLAVSSGEETRIRAKLLSQAGWFAGMLGYYNVTRRFSEDSVFLFRKLGDEVGAAFPLSNLGGHFNVTSDYQQNTQLAMESLNIYRGVGNQWGMSRALSALGYNALMHSDHEQALTFLEESLAVGREIVDHEGIAWTLLLLSDLPQVKENAGRAMELCEEALEFAKAVKARPMIAHILTEMGQLASYNGDYQRGKQLLEEAMEVHRKMGDRENVARALRYLGWTARLQGDNLEARSIYLECLQLSNRLQNNDGISATLIHIGNLMLVEGSPEKFVRLLGAAERTAPKIRNVLLPSFGVETGKFVETARAILGDIAYTAQWEAGHQMSLEEATGFALKELQ